ncbi:c-type cytochrome domain-containing protein [Luteolibacter sp. LG18]|uniref:c-type cytochrome domain-containing protein n=1 Tax=Luteolibacter sp. LG18 TaxID=2819286 RepID=UPI0030C772C7
MSIRGFQFLLLAPVVAFAEDKITYDDQIFPLFQQSCLNCHNPDKTKGGLDLSTYSGAMKGGSGGKIAEPGDKGSKIIAVCLQTTDPKMPPEGEKLGAAQIDLLKGWIEGGLLENKNSTARKPSKPKFETALKSDPGAKPEGPPPMPEHLRLEPTVTTKRASAVHSMVASPWAPLIAITGQRQVLLHHAETLELVAVLPFPEGDPVSLAFTPDGRYLIVGGGTPGKSGVTVTFDVKTGERALTVAKEFDSILAADIRPGFDVVATGGPSKLLKLWNSQTGAPIASIKKHTDWITALDISPDGILVASGDRNGGVWVWEAESGNEFHTLRAHQAAISAAAFRTDSNLLATASEDGTVRFWEMNGGSEVKKLDAHPGGVTAFAFARDGSFVTTGRDKKVRLWKPDFSPAKELAKDLPALPTAAVLSADGGRAFVADYQGTIRVYTTADGKQAGEFIAAPPSIASRLASLTEQIQSAAGAITAAEAKVVEATKAFEGSKKAVVDAEEAAKQARMIHEAAKKGEAEVRGKLEQLRQGIGARRAELERLMAEESNAVKELEAKRQALAAQPEDQRNPPELAAMEGKHRELGEKLANLRQQLDGLEAEEKTLPGVLEGSARAALAAGERIKPVDETLATRKKEVPAFEKGLNDARAELEAAKARVPTLQKAEKHWQAAAINTRALDARDGARQLTQTATDQQAEFRDLTESIAAQTAALAAKRTERAAFAAKLDDPAAKAHREEGRITLSALDSSLASRAETLAADERKLVALGDSIESLTVKLLAGSLKADDLKAAYLTALRK